MIQLERVILPQGYNVAGDGCFYLVSLDNCWSIEITNGTLAVGIFIFQGKFEKFKSAPQLLCIIGFDVASS